MGKIKQRKMKVTILLVLFVAYSQALVNPNIKVGSVETCLADIMKAVPEVSAAIASGDFSAIIAAARDTAAAIKECGAEVVDFSDECKTDYSHMKDVVTSAENHAIHFDLDGIKADLADAEATMQRMIGGECAPQPKKVELFVKFALLKGDIAKNLADN